MERSEWLLNGLSHASKLIEVGPSHSPLAPKAAGWNTTIADHATKNDLIEKYAHLPNVDQLVEEVDVVLGGHSPLSDPFPPEALGTYDAVINSHVFEHLPDPIGYLLSCAKLLAPGGTINMAIPDKRRCFDYFRPITTTGDMLEAHTVGRHVHSQRTAFNMIAYAVVKDGALGWGKDDSTPLTFVHSLEMGRGCFQRSADADQYYDFHAWCFTPSSFQLIILELTHLGLIDFELVDIHQFSPEEFLVRMRLGAKRLEPAELDQCRMRLLRQTALDVYDQFAPLKAADQAA